MQRLALSLLLLSTLAACDTTNTAPCQGKTCDEKDDGKNDKITCDEGGVYGDGLCDLDCSTPDIDCYRFFSSWAESAEAYTEEIVPRLEQSGIEALSLLPQSDPLYDRFRTVVETGWQHYATLNKRGDLPTPRVLLLDDAEFPESGAFVLSLEGQQVWLVFADASLIQNATSDDEIQAVVFHEIEHAAGLHSLPGVAKKIRKFYISPEGETERLGFQQERNPELDALGESWLDGTRTVGDYPLSELLGTPAPDSGLGKMVAAILEVGNDGCEDVELAFLELTGFLIPSPSFSTLFNPLTPDALKDISDLAARFESGLKMCLLDDPRDLAQAVSEALQVPLEEVEKGIGVDLLAPLEGKPLAEQILILASSTYEEMRATRTKIETMTGVNMDRLRYFSIEEAADDSAIRVMLSQSIDTKVSEDYFLSGMDAERDICLDTLQAPGAVPYGFLSDNHHSACWRVGHIRALSQFLQNGGEY